MRARVRRWIDDLLRWQRETCVELFSVVKGGAIIGQRPDGTPMRKATVFVDQIKPLADEAVQRARASDLWRGNPQKGIKPHPGKALAAQVEWLRKVLPTRAPEPGPAAQPSPSKMPAGEYAQKREEAIVKALEATADGIEEREGNSDLWLERIGKLIQKMRLSRQKTAPARQSWIMPSDDDDNADVRPSSPPLSGNTASTCNTPDALSSPPIPAGLCNKNVTQAVEQIVDGEQFAEGENLENAAAALEWALTFASMGVRVFPLNTVFDGVCSCPEGSECRSAGKHPLARLAPRGVKDATTDEATIQRWFTAAPCANLGIAMGGDLRLLAVDVDPRAGGDASLCDLVEAHGDAWLQTFTVKTGGLGNHFIFTLPEGVEVHRGKLAPGVDLKAEGGYLVAPPSAHASGRRYEVEKAFHFAPAPAWMIEELTRKADQPPVHVIDFQERRTGRPFGGVGIADGERNVRLFKIGCALWGRGEVGSAAELLQRLMEINFERVSPPLESPEVHKIAESISGRYVGGVPIREEGQ